MRALGIIAIVLGALLSGCAGFFPSVATYEVTTAGAPSDPDQFGKDVNICRPAAVGAGKPMTAGAVVGGAISGAAANAAGTLTSPIGAIPGLGAAGGAAGSLFVEIDPMDKRRIAAFVKCMDKLTERDRSAVIIDIGN